MVLLLSLGLTACSSGEGNSATGSDFESSQTQTATGANTETGDPRASTQAHTTRPPVTIQSIEQEVSRLRNLSLKSDIAVSYLNRDQLRQEMKAQMEKENDPIEMASQEKLLKGLGLLDQSDDLAAAIEAVMGDEVAGCRRTAVTMTATWPGWRWSKVTPRLSKKSLPPGISASPI